MEYNEVTLDSFSVIGISVRTTNKDGQSHKDIAMLWDRFGRENIIDKIPNKISNDIYCMYTYFESDYMGAYTAILGCKVNSFGNIPKGFVGRRIVKTHYKHFRAVGEVPACVGEVWSGIWQSGMERRYTADFDVYGFKAQDPKNAEVDIYVS